MRKLTTQDFIEKANKIHGDKYDYSKVQYIDKKTPIMIICPTHGEFFQKPYNHLNGCGCKECAKENRRKQLALTVDDFIKRAEEIHGDEYNYSKVKYVNANTKILIHCNYCNNDFEQKPIKHLLGQGCPYCCGERISKTKIMAKEGFIEKAKKIHGNEYDYSKIEYKGYKIPILIHCNICGNDFYQSPQGHLQGEGCPKCKMSHLESDIKHFLIDNNIEFEEQKKFDWLGRQSLDFYIPSKNIAIECQGEQHYKEKKFFGGKEGFLKRKILDDRKKKLCEENHIKLLYYAYKKWDNEVITDKDELKRKIQD